MKTFNKKSKIFSLTIAILIIVQTGLVSFVAFADETVLSTMKSKSTIVINLDTNVVLQKTNENKKIYCGFLPQLMSVAMLLESGKDLDEKITLTKEIFAETPQVSSANLKAGNKISLKDLCISALVANSQEACVAIALNLAETTEKFIPLMNEKARSLGCTNTDIKTVHGYYYVSDGENTTITDLVKIINYAIAQGSYLEFANTTYTKITVNDKERDLYSRNMFINKTTKYYLPDVQAIGISSDSKIGASGAALVTDKKMRLLSIAVTDTSVSDLYNDLKTLTGFAAEEYVTATLVNASEAVTELPVRLGKGRDSVVLITADSIISSFPKSVAKEKIERVFEIPENITAPVTKGDICGKINLMYDGINYGSVDLIAQTSVEKDILASYTEALNSFFSNAIVWICLAVILIFVIIYTIVLFYINRTRIKNKKIKNKERAKIDLE